MLNQKFGVDIEAFQSWRQLNELRLVVNTVKHGDGRSAEELKSYNSSLFQDSHELLPQISRLPLRPLVGEGLHLTSDHFNSYNACVEQFWTELIAALLPLFYSQH